MSSDQPWTIGRLLEWTTEYFKKHGSTSARLDAEILLSVANRCQRIELYTSYEIEPAESVRQQFRELVRRRAAGEPVAYLVGHREFYSLPFKVSRDVLIPRPETEMLVARLLDGIKKDADSVSQIADVGTGSGVIAICTAKHRPNCQITAIDISSQALEIARQNAERHAVDQNIRFLESDLLEQIPATTKFDWIASNPPYVSVEEFSKLDKTVSDFEPKQALIGGTAGDEIIARLIPQAAEHLNPGGGLLIEFSPMLADRVTERLEADGRFCDISVSKDLAGLSRMIVGHRS